MDFSKLKFSVVDVTKILGFVLCLTVQYYSLKSEIHNTIAVQNADKQNLNFQIAEISKDVDALADKYNLLVNAQLSAAIKPKKLQIESEQ